MAGRPWRGLDRPAYGYTIEAANREVIELAILNERKGNPTPVVHGAVTTGSEWLFLRLDGDVVTFDSRDRTLNDVGKILAYLSAIGTEEPTPQSAP
jgi:hypothetical protein